MTKAEKQKIYRKDKALGVLFKSCTDKFFSDLEKIGYHVTNSASYGGYFIFYSGSNSVVNLWLKELPKWRFGIWWSLDEENHWAKGEFFTQFECDVDKFKPSRSEFVEHISIALTKNNKSIDFERIDENLAEYSIARMLEFMVKHPYRAWARSSSGDGGKYSLPYSGLKCFLQYKSHIRHENLRNRLQAKFDKNLIDWLKANVLTFYKDVGLYKYENISPSFEFYCPLSSNKMFKSRGLYSLFWDEDECLEIVNNPKSTPEEIDYANKMPDLYNEYYAKIKHYEKVARRNGVYYYPEVSDSILVLNKKGYEKFSTGQVGL